MSEYKILDYIKFPMESTHSEMVKTCFVVYSTKEEHVPNVIGVIEDVFNKGRSYQVVLLGEEVKSGDSQYSQLIEYLNTSSFAIVILDGFRPNVLFELGILKGLNKPCIVLLEKNATVDVASYYAESKRKKSDNPKIDIDKHFSDLKDRYYVVYDRNNLKELRKAIEKQYDKLKNDIEKSVLNVLFPGLKIIEDELESCLLSVIKFSVNKNTENIDEIDLNIFVERIDRLATKHKFILSDRYYKMLANIYSILNKPSKALFYIGKSLIINPSNIGALVTKAFICADLRDENIAISAISDAIKIEPTAESLWHNKGLIFERFGKIDEAQICYEKAIECDNTCSRVHYNYSSILYEKKKYNLAIDSIDIALELEPYNASYLLLKSLIHKKQNKLPEALAAVKAAISYNANYADAWYQLGQLSDDPIDRINYYNKSLEINPAHYAALCSKGSQLSNMGKPSEALDDWKKVAKMCEKASDCSLLLLNIGTAQYLKIKLEGNSKSTDIDKIAEYFEKALKNVSDDEKCRCYNNLGYIQLDAGDYNNALSSFESAIAFANEYEPVALYNLAITRVQLNEPEIAIELFKKLKMNLDNKNQHSSCLLTLKTLPTQSFTLKEVLGNVNLLLETRKAIKKIEEFIKVRKAEQND